MIYQKAKTLKVGQSIWIWGGECNSHEPLKATILAIGGLEDNIFAMIGHSRHRIIFRISVDKTKNFMYIDHSDIVGNKETLESLKLQEKYGSLDMPLKP
jgi:hypothetical protein